MKNTIEVLSTVSRNLRSAGRQYLREPMMSSIAIASLAVALGASTYLFGFVNLLLLTPPAGLQQPERLVDVGRTMEGFGFDTLSYPNYEDLAENAKSFLELYAYTSMPVGLYEDDAPARARLTLATGNYFTALGVTPLHGRLLQPDDAHAANVVVASHAAFNNLLGGDTRRIGETVEINGASLVLIGVLPPSFQGSRIDGAADFFAPLTAAPAIGRTGSDNFDLRWANWLHAGGRLAPNASIDEANAELASLSRALEEQFPDSNEKMAFTAVPMRLLPAPFRMPLTIFTGLLFGLIGMVLLVAAGNVAGLLVARGEARRHEIAMRHVLGARGSAIVWQMMTEVFALAAVAALLGLVLALWLDNLVARVDLPIPIGVDLQVTFDWRVFGFVFALSVLTSFIAGLLPALRVSRQQPQSVIAGSATQIAGSRNRFRNVMVAAQVAFTLLLLVLAGLFITALNRAGEVELGYNIDNIHVAELDLRSARYDNAERQRIVQQIVERLEQQGNVENAAAAAVIPLYFSRMGFGGFLLDDGESLGADANVVTPAFFDTLRIPVRGREFSDKDIAGAERVTIINEVLARQLEPDGNVIGKSYRFGDPEDPWLLRVIGVTPDARYSRLDDTNIPFMYLPTAQIEIDEMNIFVRSAASPREITRMIGAAVRAADPRLAAPDVKSMDDVASFSLLPQRIAGTTAGVLGGIGALLAALGLYGLLSAHVFSRTRELGVRLTLGASPQRLMRAVLWRGLRLTVAGSLIGLAIALLLARVLDGFLFGLDAFDAMVFVLATGMLFGLGLLALLVPARRVLGIQPQEALRHD
ncbi:MAG TPA: ADOP family duplicated permease [Gammaproteobacteria bacterium]